MEKPNCVYYKQGNCKKGLDWPPCKLEGCVAHRSITIKNMYTTFEQSKELVRLGLNPFTADMYYNMFDNYSLPRITLELIMEEENKPRTYPEVYMPCWTKGALKELIPTNINIVWQNGCGGRQQGYVIYSLNPKPEIFENEYELIHWLLEYNYI